MENNYPNIKIVLTGRAAIFKESEIIKSLLINDGIKQINEQLDLIMKETPIKVRLLNETTSNTHLAFIKYIIGVNSLFLEFSNNVVLSLFI